MTPYDLETHWLYVVRLAQSGIDPGTALAILRAIEKPPSRGAGRCLTDLQHDVAKKLGQRTLALPRLRASLVRLVELSAVRSFEQNISWKSMATPRATLAYDRGDDYAAYRWAAEVLCAGPERGDEERSPYLQDDDERDAAPPHDAGFASEL